MKKLTTNFDGGLRFNWDDVQWLQTGISESMANIVKSLANQTDVFILSGCTTRTWVGYGGEGGNFKNIQLSSGIIVIKGILYPFAGYTNTAIPDAHFIWFAIDTQYDPTGVKTDKYYQEEHQCYAEDYVTINTGVAYPEGVSGVDYFPITKHATYYRPAIDYLYEILQENLQKKTVQYAVTPQNDWNTTNVRCNVCGNVLTLRGHIVASAVPEEDTAIIELPFFLADSGSMYYNFVSKWSNVDGTIKGHADLYIRGNKVYIERNTPIGNGVLVYLGATIVIN